MKDNETLKQDTRCSIELDEKDSSTYIYTSTYL